MKTAFKLLILLIIALSVSTSCSKDPVTEAPNDTVYAIRSVFGYGKTHGNFIYNSHGKLAESQSFYFYNRFIYDQKGLLVKRETAADTDLYSSQIHEKSELMTAGNSTITGYSFFEYNTEGKLDLIKNYFKNDGVFEYTSRISLEYDGSNIVKWNLHNSENTITQFYTYEYDNNGNVTREKQYSYLFKAGSEAELMSETTFKYDNQNNPFKIYKEMGQPGLYSNTNNIIESISVFPYRNETGSGDIYITKTIYTYNSKGFPVRVSTEDSDYEYMY